MTTSTEYPNRISVTFRFPVPPPDTASAAIAQQVLQGLPTTSPRITSDTQHYVVTSRNPSKKLQSVQKTQKQSFKLGQWRLISTIPQKTTLCPAEPAGPHSAVARKPSPAGHAQRAPNPSRSPKLAAAARPRFPRPGPAAGSCQPGDARPPPAVLLSPTSRSPGPAGPAPAPLTARARRRPGRESPAARKRERGDERARAPRRQRRQRRRGRLSRRPELRLQLPGAGGAFSAESRRRERGRPLLAARGVGREAGRPRALWALPGRRGPAGSAAVPKPRLRPVPIPAPPRTPVRSSAQAPPLTPLRIQAVLQAAGSLFPA